MPASPLPIGPINKGLPVASGPPGPPGPSVLNVLWVISLKLRWVVTPLPLRQKHPTGFSSVSRLFPDWHAPATPSPAPRPPPCCRWGPAIWEHWITGEGQESPGMRVHARGRERRREGGCVERGRVPLPKARSQRSEITECLVRGRGPSV